MLHPAAFQQTIIRREIHVSIVAWMHSAAIQNGLSHEDRQLVVKNERNEARRVQTCAIKGSDGDNGSRSILLIRLQKNVCKSLHQCSSTQGFEEQHATCGHHS